MQIYILNGDKSEGPYSVQQVRKMLHKRQITFGQSVLIRGQSERVYISQIEEFHDDIRQIQSAGVAGGSQYQRHIASAPKSIEEIPVRRKDLIVTTVDLKEDYDVIGPVYFQVSNKGVFSSQLGKLVKQYQAELEHMQKQRQVGQQSVDWGILYGEFSVGQADFEKAFFIAVQELKKRAAYLGADAIIGMKQDIDLDTNYFQFFYLQMYGTAVRLRSST